MECVKCYRAAIFKITTYCVCDDRDYSCGYHLVKVVKEMQERRDMHFSKTSVVVTPV